MRLAYKQAKQELKQGKFKRREGKYSPIHELKANKRPTNKPHTVIIIHSNITIQVIQAQASRQLYPAPSPILTFTQCHGQHQYFCQSVCGHLGCRNQEPGVVRSPD